MGSFRAAGLCVCLLATITHSFQLSHGGRRALLPSVQNADVSPLMNRAQTPTKAKSLLSSPVSRTDLDFAPFAPEAAPKASVRVAQAPKQVSIISSICLIAGNTLGAGVLALPTSVAPVGAGPSLLALTATWAGCTLTGLLIAETILNDATAATTAAAVPPTAADRGSTEQELESISIMNLAEQNLGPAAGLLSCATLVVLNYALLVAYITKIGESLAPLIAQGGGAGLNLGGMDPGSMAMCLYTVGLACMMQRESREVATMVQNSLMVVLLSSFASILGTLFPTVDAMSPFWATANLDALPAAVPVLVCALVFHNVIPTVVAQQRRDPDRVRATIIAGSGVPFLMYVLYSAAFLGGAPLVGGDAPDFSAAMVGQRLAAGLGSTGATGVLSAFSFSALTTSCLGTAVSQLEEFSALTETRWKDMLLEARGGDVDGRDASGASLSQMTTGVILAPPLFLALYCPPSIFERALEFGGGLGNVVLFGLVPIALAWNQRQSIALEGEPGAETAAIRLVPGGQATLIGLGAASTGLIVSYLTELVHRLC